MFQRQTQFIEEGHTVSLDTGEGKTKQSMKKESDINFIMSKYQKTGTVNFVNNNQPQYLDVDEIDYHTAMNAVISANNMFAEMPSSLRKEFHNDPGEFLEFVQNPDNREKAEELGLVPKTAAPEITPVPAPGEPKPAPGEPKPAPGEPAPAA